MDWFARFGREALTWLYPDRCELCRRIGRPPICDACQGEMVPLDDAVQKFLAGNPLDFVASVYPFEGRAAQAVKSLKYARSTALTTLMSQTLSAARDTLSVPACDAVVPVPIHWRRKNDRGFNQAELLCESFPAGTVMFDALKRIRSTRPQVGLTREQRLKNLKGAFEATHAVHGMRVLLVDDVTTTGGTLTACAVALKDQGAALVGALTYCGERQAQRSGESRP